jgi:hypothetical protein
MGNDICVQHVLKKNLNESLKIQNKMSHNIKDRSRGQEPNVTKE